MAREEEDTMKARGKEKYDSVHEQDYDRWGTTPGAIKFTDYKPPKKKSTTAKKKAPKSPTAKKKK